MRYNTRKDALATWVLWGSIILTIGVTLWIWMYSGTEELGMWGSIVFYGSMIGSGMLMLSIWYATYYDISEGELSYRCGPFFGIVDISKITKVTKGTNLSAGMKMALANNGIIIKYNRGSLIYISPENQDQFIDRLIQDNKNIEVEEK